MKKDLQAIKKELKALTKKVEKIDATIQKLEKPKPVKKAAKAKPFKKTAAKKTPPVKKTVAKKTPPKAKLAPNAAVKKPAPKKVVKVTSRGTVFAVIKESKNGVNIATLMEKTGFNRQKIYEIINVLKKKGMVTSPERGLYVKA